MSTISPSPRRRRSVMGTPQTHDSAAWTATRCHRLLRPLLSNIAALRRDSSWPWDDASQPAKPAESSPTRTSGSVNEHSKPLRRKGMTKHTYGRKTSRRPKTTAVDDGPASQSFASKTVTSNDVAMPTPVVRRLRNHQLSSPVEALRPRASNSSLVDDSPSARPKKSGRSAVDDELATLRYTVSPSKYTAYESIVRAFESLLRATSDQGGMFSSARPSSLLAMCLRKVPEYIAGRQEWEKDEAEAKGDKASFNPAEVSVQIYSDLENIGHSNGWKHLRIVVRRHGVKAITDAMGDGLFDTDYCAVLVKLCLLSNSHAEGEQILQAMTDAQFPKPAGLNSTFGEHSSLVPLRIMSAFSGESSRSFFLLNRMAQLFSNGQLPSEWLLGNEFVRLWLLAVKALSSSSSGCEGAIAFTTSSIIILCRISSRRPSRRRDEEEDVISSSGQTLVSCLAALITMLTIGHHRDDGNSTAEAEACFTINRIPIISRRVRYIFQCCLASIGKIGSGTSPDGAYLLVLSLYLAAQGEEDRSINEAERRLTESADQLRQFWKEEVGGSRDWRLYDKTVALIGTVAQCTGRGSELPSSSHLALLCGQMQDLKIQQDPFQRLEADGAFYLANRTNDLRDLAFAENLGTTSAPVTAADATEGEARAGPRRGRLSETAPPSTMFTGYRWDEGISEWVIASPPSDRGGTGKAAAISQSASSRITRSRGTTANSRTISSNSSRTRSSMEGSDTSPITKARTVRLGGRSLRRQLLRSVESDDVSNAVPRVDVLVSPDPDSDQAGTSEDASSPTLRTTTEAGAPTSHRQENVRLGAARMKRGHDRIGGRDPFPADQFAKSEGRQTGYEAGKPGVEDDELSSSTDREINPGAKRRRTLVAAKQGALGKVPRRWSACQTPATCQTTSMRSRHDKTATSALLGTKNNTRKRRRVTIDFAQESDDELCM